jgi:hypothetical protein
MVHNQKYVHCGGYYTLPALRFIRPALRFSRFSFIWSYSWRSSLSYGAAEAANVLPALRFSSFSFILSYSWRSSLSYGATVGEAATVVDESELAKVVTHSVLKTS